MEFEILNELLSGSCSQMFSDPEQHMTQMNNLAKEDEDQSCKANKSVIMQWVKEEGNRKLEESMRRLNLDAQRDIRSDLHTLSMDQLTKAKKIVKNELKYYDASFRSHFGRLPSRQEKEPMRPLYVYQKRLKQALSRAIDRDAGRIDKNKDNIATNLSLNLNSSKESISNTTKESISSISIQKDIMIAKKASDENKENILLSKDKNELEINLRDLNNKKNDLRIALQNYQKDFCSQHNRKIKFHKDITPVEKEQNMQKEIKKQINEIETALGRPKSKNKKSNDDLF